MRLALCVSVLAASALCLGNVSGSKTETWGTQWPASDFKHWVTKRDALVTPEISHLAVQACLRQSQEQLDVYAYDVAKRLLGEMWRGYRRAEARPETRAYDIGLDTLTRLMMDIDAIAAGNARDYRSQCEALVNNRFADGTARAELSPLFQGRMAPRLSPDLPPAIRAQLEKLAARGIRVAPLRWEDLRDQICTLEGYYSTSRRPELWKLFSLTRVMANVLPDPGENALFEKAALRAAQVPPLVRQLNEYSSVAGKYNGGSIGMTREELRDAPVRLTGPALGSRATSLMAFFTTAWRERLQRHVIDQNYPVEPFRLISADNALEYANQLETETRATPSQTELGMLSVWERVLPFFREGSRPEARGEYGTETAKFKKTASLAWLALNAETNIRQNEKIGGIEATSAPANGPTTAVYGTASAFERIAAELDAAVRAYRNIDPASHHTPSCVAQLRAYHVAAARAVGNEPRLAHVAKHEADVLLWTKFEPVIADIGMEVNDTEGTQPEGKFRLHLAIGYGHEVPATVKGESHTLWTPSAMVLHLNKIVSTAEWQSSGVAHYDPLAQ